MSAGARRPLRLQPAAVAAPRALRRRRLPRRRAGRRAPVASALKGAARPAAAQPRGGRARSGGGLRPRELARLVRAAAAGDRGARARVVEANLNLVRHVVRRYRAMGHDAEELFQVGCIGLLKAVDRFDPERGTRFSTYAVPLILGEIQRHLRDAAPAGLGRGAQRLAQAARLAEERLSKQLQRAPTAGEVAAALGVSAADLATAIEAARRPASLDEPVPGGEGERRPLHDRLPAADAHQWDHAALRTLLLRLPARQRQVLMLRYFRDRSQAEAGVLLGLSQPQISRLEKRALQALRRAWAPEEAPAAPAPPAP